MQLDDDHATNYNGACTVILTASDESARVPLRARTAHTCTSERSSRWDALFVSYGNITPMRNPLQIGLPMCLIILNVSLMSNKQRLGIYTIVRLS